MKNICPAIASSILAFMATMTHESEAALIINLDFASFSTGAPADGSAILGGGTLAQAQNVIETAASYWESAFAGSSSSLSWASGGDLTQSISVEWAALGGSTLASGGTSFFLPSGEWAGGSLTWDNDGSSEFFVDSTPAENSEWGSTQTQNMDFGGGSMNIERVSYDAPAGVTRDNSDMLSVAIHEVGHAIGFLGGSYPLIPNNDTGSDGDIDISSGPFSGAEIPYTGGHTNFEVTSTDPHFPYDPGGGGFFPPFDYFPNVMGPSIQTGTRKLLTESDIAFVAQFLEFDMATVNFNPSAVPEPSSFILVGAVLGSIIGRRRRRSHPTAR